MVINEITAKYLHYIWQDEIFPSYFLSNHLLQIFGLYFEYELDLRLSCVIEMNGKTPEITSMKTRVKQENSILNVKFSSYKMFL